MLVDQTNETIPLSIHAGRDFVGEGEEASMSVDIDSDSSDNPPVWVWLMFNWADEPWFQLTLEEAGLLHDRLGLILGRSGSERGPE